MSRKVQIFAALLCIVAIVAWAVPGGLALDWPIIIVIVAALLIVALLVGSGGSKGTGGGRFLCDSCAYDSERYCRRPERPNATSCPDYKSKGR